jgi:hypothetical protein
MAFEFNNAPGPRPSTHWNQPAEPLARELSRRHEHEFGSGYDVLYKDSFGRVQARMDGLTPEEAAYLRLLGKL